MRGWMVALVILLGAPMMMLGAAAGAAYQISSEFSKQRATRDQSAEAQR